MSIMRWGSVVNKTPVPAESLRLALRTPSTPVPAESLRPVSTYQALNVTNMSIIQRLVQVAAVLLQWFCCRVPQRRAHQETEEPHNDYRLLLQGSVVIAYPETKVQKVMYEEF